MPSLTEAAIEIAQSQLHVREQGPLPNRGPEVDDYLRSVGIDPKTGSFSWCAAFAHWCFEHAAVNLGQRNPFPKTGGALHVWQLAEPICRDTNPRPGLVYVLDHGRGQGHVGIVIGVAPDGTPSEISGNTFDVGGGREGNAVAFHVGTPEKTHGGELLGYLDFDRAAQAP